MTSNATPNGTSNGRLQAARTAIVTGASRGLGLALAHGLAADGWSLVIDARTGSALARARAALAATAAGTAAVVAVEGDVTNAAHRAALVAAARGLGGIDLVVNNAGVLGPSPRPRLADYPLDALGHVLAVNLTAPLGLTQAALPHLRASGGAVLAITSDAAVEPYAGWGGYAAAKAGVEQLFAVLAVEEPGVRVWVADPGDLRTQMHQEAFPGEDISDRPPPESAVPGLLHLIRDGLPSGRYRAADLAGART
jgi:NAD(P)-dependent dehydrogenase (short-subunit alcohol dehydrogenase family)